MISSQLHDGKHFARSYLRAATGHLHAELDARLAPLFKRGDAGYAQFLMSSARALLPAEQALTDGQVSTILPDWPMRSRSLALRHDLSVLSLPEPEMLPAPRIEGTAFLFGMLYVLEGSRLGAQWLLRQASVSLSPAVRTATRYLAHGQGLRLWATFLERLEASQPVRDEPRQAAAGACAAFELFLDASVDIAAEGGAVARG